MSPINAAALPPVTATALLLALLWSASATALEPAPGYTLLVEQRIPVPAERAEVYVQDGEVHQFGDLRNWYPFCRFELRGITAEQRQVEPGSFRVTGVRREERITRRMDPLAIPRAVRVQDGGPGDQIFRTYLELASEEQPQVRRLTCEELFVFGDFSAAHVSVEAINRALGDLAELRPGP